MLPASATQRRATDAPLLFVGLNELNFEYVERYAQQGDLPHFAALFREHGYVRTTSEQRYEELEPWIQWVTVHTGLDLADHGVFRLGDIVKTELPQIWEVLEAKGFRVGAISPMNAKMRLRAPAFFVPDPWTPTEAAAPAPLLKLFGAVTRMVNENATGNVDARALWDLALGVARVAAPRHYPLYLSYAARSLRDSWFRPLFLDLLLLDLFTHCVQRTRPHFATLFLNAGAHIQHHYMFSSRCYDGPQRNPDWYIGGAKDPVLDVYRFYDRALGDLRARFPRSRIVLATGLHQDPHPQVTYYWRLREHARFLELIGAPCVRVEPRMSRDFVVVCADARQAEVAARRLAAARMVGGEPLFEVDNRGTDLFVMLTYPHDLPPGAAFEVENDRFEDMRQHAAFVAIKNGEHNGIGYFVDTGAARHQSEDPAAAAIPLREIPARIIAALDVAVPGSGT